MNKVKRWNNVKKEYEEVECGAKLWKPLNGDEDDKKWIKAGSEGWFLTEHIDSIYENLINKNKLMKKDAALLSKLSDVKAKLDNEDDSVWSVKAPRKYPLGKYIKKYYKGYIDFFIGDELVVAPYTVMCM
jgi:hypothetical protein